MKSKAYWEKRSAEELIDLLKNSDEVIKELKFVYDKSIFNINTSIEKLYGKFAKDNQVSMNAAMKLIQGDEYKQWRMSMEEYLKRIEEGEEPLQLELNVLAMRSRINRLECLQAEIIANATILAQEQEKTATKHLMNAFENSYYHTMYDFYKDKNLKALELMQKHDVAISKEAIKKILEIPWSGSNYSKRIWKRQFNIANKVKELVARNIIEGKSVESLTREVTKEFGEDYRNALKTLIHTETAFVKSQADKEVYTKLDIKEYEFVATLDTKTSEICRKLDGKHFKVDEATPGKNYPPMHPRCRSLTIRYKPENYEKNTRTARDKDGNNIEVPFAMKYEGWKKYISGEFDNLEGLFDRENKYVVNNILNGTYGVEINSEKQEPHMEATAKNGKSYLFDDVNPQELFDNYAGTGIMELDRRGNKTNKEICKANRFIGINGSDGARTEVFKIHHSKKRTHISPCLEKGVKDEN